jgi:hypothetical protein
VNDDLEALEVLKKNFGVANHGILYPKDRSYIPTDKEYAAINYLFREWDYSYDPEVYS